MTLSKSVATLPCELSCTFRLTLVFAPPSNIAVQQQFRRHDEHVEITCVIIMAALRSRCEHYIFVPRFLLSSTYLLSFFLAYSQPAQIGAARGSLNYRTQKSLKIRHLRTIAQLCWAISSQLKPWFHVKIKLF